MVVLWKILDSVEDELRILIFDRVTRCQMWYHTIAIAQTHTNLLTRKWFYNERQQLLAELGSVMNSPPGLTFLNAMWSNDRAQFTANLQGRHFEKVVGTSIRTTSGRFGLLSRVFMYGHYDRSDRSLQDIIDASENTEFGPTIKWILDHRDDFMTDTGWDNLEGERKLEYSHDLMSVPASGQNADRTKPSLLQRGYTTLLPRKLLSPMEFEKRLADNILAITGCHSVQAWAIKKRLMGCAEATLIKRFHNFVRGDQASEATAYVSEWLDARPMSTRDIEARGGALSKSARKANYSGSVVENLPTYIAERLVPAWVPWLQPQFPEGKGEGKKPRVMGVADSFSPLDGRQPTTLYNIDTTEDLKVHLWGQDPTFEEQTLGLISMSDLQKWEREFDYAEGGDPFDACRDHLNTMPPLEEKEVRAEMKTLLEVDETDVKLTEEQKKSFNNFHYDVTQLPRMLTAEFAVVEHLDFITDRTVTGQKAWQRGRLHAVFIYGVWINNQRRFRPTLLNVSDGTRDLVAMVYDVDIAMVTVYLLILNRAEFRDLNLSDLDMPDSLDMSAKNVLPAQPAGAASSTCGVERLLPPETLRSPLGSPQLGGARKKSSPKAQGRDMVEAYEFPNKPANYMFPFPTSMVAEESKLLTLLMKPTSIRNASCDDYRSLYVVENAKYEVDDLGRQRIVLGKDVKLMTPLVAADENGFFLRDSFSKGYQSSRKADVSEVVHFLVREQPLRLELLRGNDWAPVYIDELDHDPIIEGPEGPVSCKSKEEKDMAEGVGTTASQSEGDGPKRPSERKNRPSALRPLSSDHLFSDIFVEPATTGGAASSSSAAPAAESASPGKEQQNMTSTTTATSKKTAMKKAKAKAKSSAAVAEDESGNAAPQAVAKSGKEKPTEAGKEAFWRHDENNTKPMVMHLFQHVEQLSLTVRQWVEVYYVLSKGMKAAEEFLVKKKFYPLQDALNNLGEYVITHVSTIQQTADTVIMKLYEAHAQHQESLRRVLEVEHLEPERVARERKKKGGVVSDAQLQYADANLTDAINNPDLARSLGKRGIRGTVIIDGDGADAQDASNLICRQGSCSANVDRSDEANIARQFFLTGKGKEQLTQSELKFHRTDVSLLNLHVNERNKKRDVHCSTCGREIGIMWRVWIMGKNGPLLRCHPVDDSTQLLSTALGPCSHVKCKAPGGKSRCFCGWWRGQQCYEDEAYQDLTRIEKVWTCAEVQAQQRLMELHPQCSGNCGPKKFKCKLPGSATFTARTAPAAKKKP
ncbi:unnamed protein product [Amoebophrya sp. A25]|nr:unnamed protein product [Amoebophrya sp. A25]|eukprot:GSA25T00011902001.1